MKKILILVLACTTSIYCSEESFDPSKGRMLHGFIKSSGNKATEWLKDFLNDQGCLKKTDLEQTDCCCNHKTPLCAAALLGQLDTVKILLKAKFGPNLEFKVNPNSGFRKYNPVFGIYTTAPVLP